MLVLHICECYTIQYNPLFILFTNELGFFTNLAVCSEVNLLKQAGFVEAGPVVGIEEQVEVEESHHQVGEHLV